MLSHADVWRGVDRLAEANNLTPSGLARRSGLDPTTFNKSKRSTRNGRPRWPSTESLAKILEATQTSLGGFVALVDPAGAAMPRATLPCARLSAMTVTQFDGAGFPANVVDRIELRHLASPHLYAVEVDDDEQLPVYRHGDTLLVAPDSSVQRGERVIMMPKSGRPQLGVLARRTADQVSLGALNDPTSINEIDLVDVAWLARIVWASQ